MTTENNTANDIRTAFALGTKVTVTPRGGSPIELTITPFYVFQTLELLDDIAVIWSLMKETADDKGDVNMLDLLMRAKDQVIKIILCVTEKDMDFIGSLPMNDLITVIETVFTVNKDFFGQRVAPMFQEMFGLLSSTQ